jgi:hypothetical protein
MTFKQTFLQYLGGLNKNIWGLEDCKAIWVLQAIWIEVYKGDKKIGEKKVVYVVRKGDAVHKMVKFSPFLMFSLLMLPYNCQAIQRATEWRNSLASMAFYVVNDFFDSKELATTEGWQDLASDLLADTKYAFLRMKEVVINGEKQVYSKASLFSVHYWLSSSRSRKLAAIEDLSSYICLLSTLSILRMQSLFQVSLMTMISPRWHWHSLQLQYIKATFDIGDTNLSIRSTVCWILGWGSSLHETCVCGAQVD